VIPPPRCSKRVEEALTERFRLILAEAERCLDALERPERSEAGMGRLVAQPSDLEVASNMHRSMKITCCALLRHRILGGPSFLA
jgi:hypothetical protein